MKWSAVERDYAASEGEFVFRLHHMKIGVFGSGTAYSLQIRKKDECQFVPLGYAFWTHKENGGDRNPYDSVDRILWDASTFEGRQLVKKRAEKILKDLQYISSGKKKEAV